MILARDERIFLIILAVNLVVALVYLLGGILFVVPVQAEITGGHIFCVF